MNKVRVAEWSELEPVSPAYAQVSQVDLVVIRWREEEQVSVLYGRCLHRGALLSDGSIDGENLICGVHLWDYRYKTGVSEYNNDEALHRFSAWVDTEADAVLMDGADVATWAGPIHRPSSQAASTLAAAFFGRRSVWTTTGGN